MSGHVVGSAFDFLSSPDFLVQGVLATRRERLAAFRRLYACQWTCQTIFQRALSSVAQNYVVRLLCVTEPVQVELVDKWIMPGSASEQKHREALWQLQRLCVVVPAEILVEDSEEALPDHLLPPRLQDSEAGILLNPVFQKKLRAQLFAIETPLEEGALDWTQEDYMATERASRARWKRVLWYILRCSSSKDHSLRLDKEVMVENVLYVHPIVPLLEDIELIRATRDTKWFYEDVKVDRATTSGRKRTITGADSDSDDEGGPGTNGSSGAPGGYEEEFDRNLWDKLRPPDGGVVNLPLQTVLPKGFEFLLMDTEQQMWFFVEQYLRLQTVMADRISVLQLVFQLSYCTPGRQYHVRRLNAAQTWALRKFSAVGITLLRSRKSQYFQVGVYGSNLLFGHDMEVGAVPFGKKERLQAQQQTALKRSDGSDGVGSRFEWERDELISSRLELMVETNFYVTAFVSEDPEIAEIEKDVLRLFMVLEVALPDAIICQIKPNETREALRRGITAAQMQQFLERHAHVRMRQKALTNLEREFGDEAYGQDAELDEEMDSQYHAIPHNVVEQLHMWEQEENRLNDKPAALFKDCFANEIEYNRCIEFCKEHQCLLWESREKYIIVVDESHSEALTNFIRAGAS